MPTTVLLKLNNADANNDAIIKKTICNQLKVTNISSYKIIKKSIDARSRIVWVNLTLLVHLPQEKIITETIQKYIFEKLKPNAKQVVVIGAGPAGIFAALQLIQLGIQPLVLDRGKDVRSRRRDLAVLNKEGILNTESNYCFGEGGAGTYSDGKLYTRSNKRGNIQRILQLFVQFGADAAIEYEAHPHIGTNKLPQIITAMRLCIEECGGLFLFNHKVIDIAIKNEKVTKVIIENGNALSADAFILATGHSARDVFELLLRKKIEIIAKPFALGVRIEHPQIIIDQAQYKCDRLAEQLPPASYSLVQQANGKGVFSFCMCPGGIIATASTAHNELVVNGWSPSKRNNPYANSGMVVEVNMHDVLAQKDYGITENPLAMLQFQSIVEQKCFAAGGGKFVAPAQRLVDFVNNKPSTLLPKTSYLPGVATANINELLPNYISKALAVALQQFGNKIKGYYTNEAVLVATESRTSSPVKIPRDAELLHHPQLKNLYPCGEGAGYAGGIVSAAMDGERVAQTIAAQMKIL